MCEMINVRKKQTTMIPKKKNIYANLIINNSLY